MNMQTKQIADDILKFTEGGRLLTKTDIGRYLGSGRTVVDRITKGLKPVGGKCTYFYLDLAEELTKLGRVAR